MNKIVEFYDKTKFSLNAKIIPTLIRKLTPMTFSFFILFLLFCSHYLNNKKHSSLPTAFLEKVYLIFNINWNYQGCLYFVCLRLTIKCLTTNVKRAIASMVCRERTYNEWELINNHDQETTLWHSNWAMLWPKHTQSMQQFY